MKRPVVVVTGSRHSSLVGRARVWAALSALNPKRVLVGCCRSGADAFAREWCKSRRGRVTFRVFRADWLSYGRDAGPLRNARMVEAGADAAIALSTRAVCLAFPRGGPGTADCLRRARGAGFRVVKR